MQPLPCDSPYIDSKLIDDMIAAIAAKSLKETKYHSTRSICEFLCEHFKLKVKPHDLETAKRAHFTKLFFEDSDLQLLDGVEDLIKNYHANGLTLVIASSASMFTINNVMKRFELDPYFKDKLTELQYMQRAYPGMEW